MARQNRSRIIGTNSTGVRLDSPYYHTSAGCHTTHDAARGHDGRSKTSRYENRHVLGRATDGSAGGSVRRKGTDGIRDGGLCASRGNLHGDWRNDLEIARADPDDHFHALLLAQGP